MKKMIPVLCSLILVLSGCQAKYQRISFDGDTPGEQFNHINADTRVENTVDADFSTSMPIYKISERNISQQEYDQMLEALELPGNPRHSDLEGNRLFYNLASFVDSSRGYFELSDEEVEKLAWEIFNKIPFLEGEFECLGIKDTYTINDSTGDHIARAGVSFRRLLDGVRVIGEDNCTLYFDGSGLVAIRMALFEYEQTGTMDMIPVEEAADRINAPDNFIFDAVDASQEIGVADTLEVERINLLLVNHYSRGCTILQPVYSFVGTATDSKGAEAVFKSIIIAIPEAYTYEAKS